MTAEAGISKAQLGSARRAAETVFHEIGTRFARPFRDELAARALIYPIDYTMLDGAQFSGVASAASAVGDSHAYLAPYGTVEGGWFETYDHRMIRLDLAEYRAPGELVLEHLLYSPRGLWGVVTSHGDFAVVGGTRDFIDGLAAVGTTADASGVRAFVRQWRDVGAAGGNIDWLDPLLEHLFGSRAASELLETA